MYVYRGHTCMCHGGSIALAQAPTSQENSVSRGQTEMSKRVIKLKPGQKIAFAYDHGDPQNTSVPIGQSLGEESVDGPATHASKKNGVRGVAGLPHASKKNGVRANTNGCGKAPAAATSATATDDDAVQAIGSAKGASIPTGATGTPAGPAATAAVFSSSA